jgi:hypothetical protein
LETLQLLLAERGVDADRRLLAAFGADDRRAGQLAVAIGRGLTPLGGRLEATSENEAAPTLPVTIPPAPRQSPVPALIFAIVAVASIVAVSVVVGTVVMMRSADPPTEVGPLAAVATTGSELPANVIAPRTPLVTERAFAAWLEEHQDWGQGRARRKDRAGEGYLEDFEPRAAGSAPMVGVSYAAAAAFCAARDGVAPVDAAPTTWSGSVPQEWRAGSGSSGALRSRTGTVIPEVVDTWVEPNAGFRCAR